MSLKWVVIADDLTGACDTGVAFKTGNNKVKVVLSPDIPQNDADILVFSTSSRYMHYDEMRRSITEALSKIKEMGSSANVFRVYKKVDSTLRGNPRGEFQIILQGLGLSRALVATAFPEQGRVVRGARVFVNDVPLEETVFAEEVAESNLLKMFNVGGCCTPISLSELKREVGYLAERVSKMGGCVWVADSETTDDLAVLARLFFQVDMRLACGSAGLARALAGQMDGKRITNTSNHFPKGRVLVVAGSRHPITVKQVMAGLQTGYKVIDAAHLLRIDKNGIEGISQNGKEADEAERHCIVINSQPEYSPEDEKRTIQQLAFMAKTLISSERYLGVVLTGGETAAEVCRSLDVKCINLLGEVSPGVVVGALEGGLVDGMGVVLKAGGFGNENSLIDAVRFLSGE